MRRISSALGALAIAGALGPFAEPALAGGFEFSVYDAKQLGLAKAFTAIADTPAANAQNPAGLSQLDGVQASLSVGYVQAWIHFEADDPIEGEENNRTGPRFFPTTFASIELPKVGDMPLHLGLGVFVPFATDVLWQDDWPGRYISIHTQVQTVEVNPNLALRVPLEHGNSISFGAGFSLVKSDLMLKQAIDFSSLGAPDGILRLRGSSENPVDLGFDAGVLFSQAEGRLKVGLSYRSEIEDIDIEGRGEFFNIPTNPLTGQPALPAGTKADATLNYPDRVRAGVAMQVDEPLTVAVEFAWTNWSRLKRVVINLPTIGRTSALNLRWHDSYYVALAAEYKAVPELLALRAGAYWDQTPTRDVTFSPSIPDNNRWGFSLGAGITPSKAFSIDLAYYAVFLEEGEKDNDIGADRVIGGSPRAQGDFNAFGHVAMITLGLKF